MHPPRFRGGVGLVPAVVSTSNEVRQHIKMGHTLSRIYTHAFWRTPSFPIFLSFSVISFSPFAPRPIRAASGLSTLSLPRTGSPPSGIKRTCLASAGSGFSPRLSPEYVAYQPRLLTTHPDTTHLLFVEQLFSSPRLCLFKVVYAPEADATTHRVRLNCISSKGALVLAPRSLPCFFLSLSLFCLPPLVFGHPCFVFVSSPGRRGNRATFCSHF